MSPRSELEKLEETLEAARQEYRAAHHAGATNEQDLFQRYMTLQNRFNNEWAKDAQEHQTENVEPLASYPRGVVAEVVNHDFFAEGVEDLYFIQRFREMGRTSISENDLINFLLAESSLPPKWITQDSPTVVTQRINAELTKSVEKQQRHEMSVPTVLRAQSRSSVTTKATVQDIVTSAIFEQLEKGVVPWHQPWKSTGGRLPRSMSTGLTYTGTNALLLGVSGMKNGWPTPWFGTHKQITELGGVVNKGEHGTPVVFYKSRDTETEEGTIERRPPILRYFTVFNAAQTTGLPEKYTTMEPDLRTEPERIGEAEAVVERYLADDGPTLKTGWESAYYLPSVDEIRLPSRKDFLSPEDLYSTLFHELAHSTGHKSRLNREGVIEGHRFGSESYSREELLAEVAAAMSCAALGIDQTITVPNSAAYIQSWLTALRNDKSLILQAAAGAQKAVTCLGIPGMEKRVVKNVEVAKEVEAPIIVASPTPSVPTPSVAVSEDETPSVNMLNVEDGVVVEQPPIVIVKKAPALDTLEVELAKARHNFEVDRASAQITAITDELQAQAHLDEIAAAEDDLRRAQKNREGTTAKEVLVGEALAADYDRIVREVSKAECLARDRETLEPAIFVKSMLMRKKIDLKKEIVEVASRKSDLYTKERLEIRLAAVEQDLRDMDNPLADPVVHDGIIQRVYDETFAPPEWREAQRKEIEAFERERELKNLAHQMSRGMTR